MRYHDRDKERAVMGVTRDGIWWRARLLGAVVTVVVLLIVPPALGTGCFGGGAQSKAKQAQSSHLSFGIGQVARMDQARVSVTAMAPVAQPARPDVVIAPGESPAAAPGEVFYQARIRLENGGDRALRVDPRDFSLVGKGDMISIDPTASGPPARSLLPGTSLYLILTFRAPADLSPLELVYDPPWFDGDLRVKGDQKPAGQASRGGTAAG
jgi:Domain of unknown function (DUF4352)